MLFRLTTALVALLTASPLLAQVEPQYDPDDKQHQAIMQHLRENRRKYGDDATILQGLLMAHAVDGDAVLTAESGIKGFHEDAGKKYLRYKVATGMVLNDKFMNLDGRLSHIWDTVLEKSFLTYPSFSVPADGVLIELTYNHKPYGTAQDLYREMDDLGPLESARFFFLSEDIGHFIAQKLPAKDLLARARVHVDDRPVDFVLQQAMTVPRRGSADAAPMVME